MTLYSEHQIPITMQIGDSVNVYTMDGRQWFTGRVWFVGKDRLIIMDDEGDRIPIDPTKNRVEKI